LPISATTSNNPGLLPRPVTASLTG
jgi:hypothetical protein